MLRIKDATKTLQGITIVVGSGFLLDEDADGHPRIIVQNGGAGTTFDSALNIQATTPGNHRQLRLIDKATATKYNWMIGTQPSGDDVEITPSTTIGGTTFSTPSATFKVTGEVGIGIVPSVRFHVSAPSSGIRFDFTSGGNGRVVFGSNNSVGRMVLQDSTGVAAIEVLNAGDNRLWGKNAADWTIFANAIEYFRLLATNGFTGFNTTAPSARVTAKEPSNATQTNFTQAVSKAGFLIESDYVANNFVPGLFWHTTNDNATKPKAGVYLKLTSTGSWMYFGTSDAYATGMTYDSMTIDPLGNVSVLGSTASNKGKFTANRVVLPVGADKWAT